MMLNSNPLNLKRPLTHALSLVAASCLIGFAGSPSRAAVPTPSADPSQPPKAEQDAIRKFAGCYEITFDFAETFPHDPKTYKIADPYHAKALEYVVLDEDTGDRLSLQHILLFQGGLQKHWRQEWDYDRASVFQYQGENTWLKATIAKADSEGRWVQRVFQVDDSPQYECSAPWVHWGHENYWECASDRPIPRRDYTQRSDYQIITGRNRQSITADGWTLEEDNTKVVLANGVRTPLVKERGENVYRKVDDSLCQTGADYWAANRGLWHAISTAWEDVYNATDKIQIKTPKGQPPLYITLLRLEAKAEKSRLGPAALKTETARIINSYLVK